MVLSSYIRGTIIIAVTPFCALPLLRIAPESPSVGRTAWAAALMAVYWATEALPIAVTSLLPIVLFPTLGVMEADEISRNYFKDKIVLFFGGLVVAAALEAVQLQKRIALRVLLLFGTRPPQLLLGFMCSTAFISMWMSNTATAAMMMPIAEAVLKTLHTAVLGKCARRPPALGWLKPSARWLRLSAVVCLFAAGRVVLTSATKLTSASDGWARRWYCPSRETAGVTPSDCISWSHTCHQLSCISWRHTCHFGTS